MTELVAAFSFSLGLVGGFIIAMRFSARSITERERTITELIDKFVHNRAPERIVERDVKREAEKVNNNVEPALDPVSAMERLAEREAMEQ